MNIDWTVVGMIIGAVWVVVSSTHSKPVKYVELERSYLRQRGEYVAPVQR